MSICEQAVSWHHAMLWQTPTYCNDPVGLQVLSRWRCQAYCKARLAAQIHIGEVPG